MDARTGTPSMRHYASEEEEWADAEIREAMTNHALLTWGPSAGAGDMPIINKAEGVYVWDTEGKRYIDWTSQAVCCNLGYDVPEEIQKAITGQLGNVSFAYGGLGIVPV